MQRFGLFSSWRFALFAGSETKINWNLGWEKVVMRKRGSLNWICSHAVDVERAPNLWGGHRMLLGFGEWRESSWYKEKSVKPYPALLWCIFFFSSAIWWALLSVLAGCEEQRDCSGLGYRLTWFCSIHDKFMTNSLSRFFSFFFISFPLKVLARLDFHRPGSDVSSELTHLNKSGITAAFNKIWVSYRECK